MDAMMGMEDAFAGAESAAAAGGAVLIVQLAILVLMLVVGWKVFTKAGQPGWAVIVPIYNMYVMLKIAGKPGWWLLLFFVPIVNLVIGILTLLALAENFGKGAGFAMGMLFLPIIFYPILAFGSAEYQPAQAA